MMSLNSKRTALMAMMVLPILLCSCTPSNHNGSTPSESASMLGSVDPQVLSDVIDGTFFVPGDAMIRAMRIDRAISSIEAVDCGGKPFEDLDYTGDRFNQAWYPDLNLIAEKNLVETGPTPAGDRVGDDTPCRYKSLPRAADIMTLSLSWDDVTRAALSSDQMQPVLASTAACLSKESGFDIANTDPTARYLADVDYNLSGDGTDWNAGMSRYSKIYVDCVGDFESTMKAILIDQRTSYVERNRELLTEMALDLSAAGYTP